VKDPFIRTLTKLAVEDDRVFLIVGDLGFGMVESFIEKCPKQFLNVGVAEQNMIGVATGLALEGYKVFCYSIANFGTLRCLEQIRNDACYHGANVKVVAMGGGFSYGALGISHHATEDIAILRSLPEMTVVVPGDDWEAGEATAALANLPGTAYLRLDKMSLPGGEGEGPFIIGRSRRLREGQALTLVVAGGIRKQALAAAAVLESEGIQCRVEGFHSIKPLDTAALISASRETGGILTIEEHTVDGGFGSAVCEALMDSGEHPRQFRRMGLRAGFSSVVGSQVYLQEKYGLDAVAIAAAAREMVGHG